MEIPITNPHLSAELSDSSKTDESITTSGTTVNVGPGGVIQQHCGNQKGEREFTRIMSTFLILLISIICDAFIFAFIHFGNNTIIDRFDRFESNADKIHQRLEDAQQKIQESQTKMEQRHNEVIE